MNREIYETLNLTLAQHPSETTERMMVRVLAFCINFEERLSFTKGLSEVEEPDIWSVEYNEDISLWIDVGEPDGVWGPNTRKAIRLFQLKNNLIADGFPNKEVLRTAGVL